MPAPVCDRDAAGAVEAEPDGDPRLGGRAQVADARGPPAAATGAGRSSSARERLDEQVVVDPVADRDPDPVVVGADDEPLPEQRVAERRARPRPGRRGSSRARRAAARPIARSADGEPLALLDHRPARRAARRARRPRARPRASRPAPAPGARSARRRRRARRARSRSARRRARRPSRTCAARSRRRRAAGSRSRRSTRSTPRRRRAAARRAAARSSPSGLFGRQVKVSDRVVVADLGARELRGDAVERVGRRGRDRDRVAGPGEAARAEQDQVVGADAEHDLVGVDAVVVGDRAAQLVVAAGRVAADRRRARRRSSRAASTGAAAAACSGRSGRPARGRSRRAGRPRRSAAPRCRRGTRARAASSPHRRRVRGHPLGGGERLDRRPEQREPLGA